MAPSTPTPRAGAIAHPLGISGARLVLPAAIELSNRGVERAVATMCCIGVGQGHLATPAVGLIGIHLAEVSRCWR
jgi:acetyl-CoA acetyltransferase